MRFEKFTRVAFWKVMGSFQQDTLLGNTFSVTFIL